MYVRDQTADRLFAGATALPGPGGRSMLVPKPEHLIAMKVQAMKDAPERGLQDLVDIAYLLQVDGVDRAEVHGSSFEPALRTGGMRSQDHDSDTLLDFERDVPTTAEDVAALRRLRRDVPSWFSLTPGELEALLPQDAVDRRPVTSANARPFVLP
jgi:hypothetical protein